MGSRGREIMRGESDQVQTQTPAPSAGVQGGEPQPEAPQAGEIQTAGETPEEEKQVPRELTEKERARLLTEIERNPEKYKREAKYILFLTLSSYASGWYRDVEEFEIIDGDAETVRLEFSEMFGRTSVKYAVIPRTVPVVVKFKKHCNYCDGRGEWYRYYIFNGREWIEVDA